MKLPSIASTLAFDFHNSQMMERSRPPYEGRAVGNKIRHSQITSFTLKSLNFPWWVFKAA